MKMIDLYSRNPFSHNVGEKVMGFDLFRGHRFMCGAIVDRKHSGNTNAYVIESEYGEDYSGTLHENSILPFDEKVVLEEMRKDNRLTIKIVYHFGVSVIVEKDRKEIFCESIEGDGIEPGELLKSYEKLLEFLGFKPDLDRMYMGDGLLVLQFDDKNKNEDENKKEM